MICAKLTRSVVCQRMLLAFFVGGAAGVIFPVGAADLLPTFKSGEFSGNFAVYRHEHFDGVINKKGKLTIQPKKAGKAFGKPLPAFHYMLQYPEKVEYTRDPERRIRPGKNRRSRSGTRTEWRDRPIVSLEKKDKVGEPEPVKQPDDLTLQGKTENGTRFTLVYKFRENSVSYGIGVREASNAEKPTRVRWVMQIPRSHDIPDAEKQPKRKKMLEDCLLVTKPRGVNEKVRHDYAKVLFFDENPLERALVRGPWGPLQLRIETDRFDKHRFWGQARGGSNRWRCPWEGFNFRFRLNRDAVTIYPQYEIKLTIE